MSAPCLNLDLRKSYTDLLERYFTEPASATPYYVDQARQAILFRLDEKDARLVSWTELYAKPNGDTPPRRPGRSSSTAPSC